MFDYAKPEQKQAAKSVAQTKETSYATNSTGISDTLKSKFESLSGFSFDDIRVHYNSNRPAQEKHLTHELGHVVQQKQGKVRNIQRQLGYSINIDRQLEKEADEYEQLTTSQYADMDNRTLNDAAISSDVIQCKLGFEFETSWLIKKVDDKSLAKNELIIQKEGYALRADEAGQDSDIEFITEAKETKEEMTTIMQDIKSYGDSLIASVSIDEAEDTADYQENIIHGFKVKPAGDYISAHPQVTFGTGLDTISMLAKRVEDEDGVAISHVAKSTTKTTHMEGLVTILKKYIQSAYQLKASPLPVDYPKMITDSFLLARTDFAKLYQLALSHDDIELQENDWLGKFADLGVDGNEKLFGEILDTESVGGTSTPDLTIIAWLKEIRNGVDNLKAIENAESMGALNDKTDTVEGKSAGIFEYRAGQTLSLELEDWESYAEKWFDRITQINS